MIDRTQEEITRIGNPARPQGEEGRLMLERMNNSHAQLTEWGLSILQFEDSDTVLDIGCGGGAALGRASPHMARGKLFGVDYSPVSVSLACENNAVDIGSGKMHISEASVESLPFEDMTFDRIYTIESFYFWKEPLNALHEVYRVLKNGGSFAIIADIYNNGRLSYQTLENVARYNMNNPTAEEFRQYLETAGFCDVKIHILDGTDWICAIGKKPLA